MYHGKAILTDDQKDYLVRHFKDTDNEYLALRLGISESTLHRYARRWELKKSRAHCRRMQQEAAMAAKASHLAHGTYPPKGYRIPRSEEFQFKPGETNLQRLGKRRERERIEKAAATRRARFLDERIRVMRGLPQETRMKVTQQPRQRIQDRSYLKKCGYVLNEENGIAYWTPETRRATRLEAGPKRYYDFKPYNQNE